MNVNILTSGYWPSYPIIDAKMPAELNDYQQARSGSESQAPVVWSRIRTFVRGSPALCAGDSPDIAAHTVTPSFAGPSPCALLTTLALLSVVGI